MVFNIITSKMLRHVLQSPSKHDGVIKSLEKQLDYYKEECASLQEMVKKKLVDSAQTSPRKKGKVERYIGYRRQ